MPNDYGYAFAQGEFDRQEGSDPFEPDNLLDYPPDDESEGDNGNEERS